MEAHCAQQHYVVPLCQSHHAADSLLHPGYTHPPLAAGAHRPAHGEDSIWKSSIKGLYMCWHMVHYIDVKCNVIVSISTLKVLILGQEWLHTVSDVSEMFSRIQHTAPPVNSRQWTEIDPDWIKQAARWPRVHRNGIDGRFQDDRSQAGSIRLSVALMLSETLSV